MFGRIEIYQSTATPQSDPACAVLSGDQEAAVSGDSSLHQALMLSQDTSLSIPSAWFQVGTSLDPLLDKILEIFENNCPFLWCFILYSGSNLPIIPGISSVPTFSFQSPMMKRTSFVGVSSRRSSYNHSASASMKSVVGAQSWITVMSNGLPQK